MSSSPACLVDDAVDWENSQVYTYCGNCKGVMNLIDKYNELKRSYESALKLNELLVRKIAALESDPFNRGESYGVEPSWNEDEERAAFQTFMANISKHPVLPSPSSDHYNPDEPRLRDLKVDPSLYELTITNKSDK